MVSVRSVVASLVFLMGAAVPAFCQVIVPPNIPGAAIPADLNTGHFAETVFSTGTFDFSLAVLRNGQLKHCVSATVCTSGPFTTVKVDLPFNRWGLVAGDSLIFAFQVRHRGTEGNTISTRVTIIPVIAGATAPPTQTTHIPRTAPLQSDCWAKREDA